MVETTYSSERLYPVMLRLNGRPCLVVGAGPIGTRKTEGLLDAGAVVTVVAPEISATLLERASIDPALRLAHRTYEPGEVANYFLAITATGIEAVDQQVADDGDAAAVFVNSADDPDRCAFYLPSVHRQGSVIVSVSTSGQSPALAQFLRRKLARQVGPPYAILSSALQRARLRIQGEGGSTETIDWTAVIDDELVELASAEESSTLDAAIDERLHRR